MTALAFWLLASLLTALAFGRLARFGRTGRTDRGRP